MNATDTERPGLGTVLAAQGRRSTWLADQLGVHRSTVTRWTNGQVRMPRTYVIQVAELLRVTEDQIR
jgi:DNA-binding transcriptional regulator YdaS (Cro superfamily)